jgi:hypothetical protein
MLCVFSFYYTHQCHAPHRGGARRFRAGLGVDASLERKAPRRIAAQKTATIDGQKKADRKILLLGCARSGRNAHFPI